MSPYFKLPSSVYVSYYLSFTNLDNNVIYLMKQFKHVMSNKNGKKVSNGSILKFWSVPFKRHNIILCLHLEIPDTYLLRFSLVSVY